MHVGVNARTFSVKESRGSEQASMSSIEYLNNISDAHVQLFGHDSLNGNFPQLPITNKGFWMNSQAFGLIWEQTWLPYLADTTDIDVLFCPNSDGPMRPVSTPVVVRIHDLFGFRGEGPMPYTALQRMRVPRMITLADAIITPTKKVKSEIESQFDTGKIEVVPNGLDENLFAEGFESYIDVPERYLLYVGGTDPRKNMDGLLKGFEYLIQQTDIDIKLVLVGPQSRFIEGKTDIVTDVNENIINLGYVSDPQLKYIYKRASVYIHPSYDEGFGLTPLEAMACGTPVVSSNHQPMPDVLGKAPMYFDPNDPIDLADAIFQLLTSPDLYRECEATGRKQADIYRWHNSATRIKAILESVL